MFNKSDLEKLENFLFQQCLSIIRHDLNNYLTVILNYSNFVENNSTKDKLKTSVKNTIQYLKNDAEKEYNLENKAEEPISSNYLIENLKTKLNEFNIESSIKKNYSKRKIAVNKNILHLIIIRFLMDSLEKNERMSLEINEHNDYLILKFNFENNHIENQNELYYSIIKRYFEKKSIDLEYGDDKNFIMKIPYLKKSVGED